MQTALSMIWICVAVSISNDGKHHKTNALPYKSTPCLVEISFRLKGSTFPSQFTLTANLFDFMKNTANQLKLSILINSQISFQYKIENQVNGFKIPGKHFFNCSESIFFAQSSFNPSLRLKKRYLMSPCLSLSLIRYGSRVSGTIQERNSLLPYTSKRESYLLYYIYTYIYIYLYIYISTHTHTHTHTLSLSPGKKYGNSEVE